MPPSVVVEPDDSWIRDKFVVSDIPLDEIKRLGYLEFVGKALNEAYTLRTIPASIRYIEGMMWYDRRPKEELPKIRFMLNAPIFAFAKHLVGQSHFNESKRIVSTYGYGEEPQQRMHSALDRAYFDRAFYEQKHGPPSRSRSIVEKNVTTPGRRLSMLGYLGLAGDLEHR